MQLTTWPLARLGSRPGFLFEPQRRRVMHSALGRFLDQPLDLAVGLVTPDGTERVMPFTPDGQLLFGCEQFERINSITYRGHCESCGVRLELNFHSPFYPQDEAVCLLPVIYMELRVIQSPQIRSRHVTPPQKVRLFVRLKRPDTQIQTGPGRIDLSYQTPLRPHYSPACGADADTPAADERSLNPARVRERIHSLNEGAEPLTDAEGRAGLTLELPVAEEGSGIKWRLVWAAHTADPVLRVNDQPATLRYAEKWRDLDAVMADAIANRDENLALSRRFEKLLDQAPLDRSQWHLLALSFQTYLANTFWCRRQNGSDLFTIWGGCNFAHSPITAAYHETLFLLALWPRLMRWRLEQWCEGCVEHAPSGGLTAVVDLGRGLAFGRGEVSRHRTLDVNATLLLMLQAYVHWTGDTELPNRHPKLIDRLAMYVHWADRDGSGFPADSTVLAPDDDAQVNAARRHTWLAIKRATALSAAADLLSRAGAMAEAERYSAASVAAVAAIEEGAWLTDHYGYAPGPARSQLLEPGDGVIGSTDWNDYTIKTAYGLLLPTLIAQPLAFDPERLRLDLTSSHRETLRNYGCTDASSEISRLSISGNLWRDLVAHYLHIDLPPTDARYWDLQLYSNTGEQSLGYCDSYIVDEIAFSTRGLATFGYFLAGPRLQIDRLDGGYIAVDPDRLHTQRWPLLPLADWPAGKIPICYVDTTGAVRIEGRLQTVKIIGQAAGKEDVIG